MATLTGTTIQSTYDSLLKVTDNDAITATLKRITDGLGNNTPLYLSSSAVEISSGLNVVGSLTASNVSGSNTGDETKSSIETKLGAATASNSGFLTSSDWSTFNNKIAGTGTLNRVAKFSSTGSIADSNITDTGSLITLNSGARINGNIGIDASPSVNVSLRSLRNITGSTASIGTLYDGAVQSDVTGSAAYYRSTAQTAAATFTLPDLFHFQATQGTLGAGSVVTNQSAFRAASNLIGATNNFGFFGDIAAGTGRWNLYMNGTAQNYIAGPLGIGTTSIGTNAIAINRGTTGATTATTVSVVTNAVSDVTTRLTAVVTQLGTDAAAFTLGNLEHFRAQQATVGAGSTVTQQNGFVAASNLIGATDNYGFRGLIPAGTGRWNLFMDGTANNHMAGSLGIGSTSLTGFHINIGRTLTGSVTSRGIHQSYSVASDVTNAAIINSTSISTQAAAFTLPQLTHYFASQVTIGAGSVVTNQNGFRVDNTLIGATNNYAFKGEIASGTGRWNLFMDGTANNHMAGRLGIGITDLTDTSLYIANAITGATTANNVLANGQVRSDVTSQARYFQSIANTQATTFTANQIHHYAASQGTFGAGSTVNVQNGFIANSSLIGATSNFGFRGLIPSGTGRWNLYMDGTAGNYLAGNLSIGTTTTGRPLTLFAPSGQNNYIEISGNGNAVATASFAVGQGADNNAYLFNRANSALIIATNATERARFLAGGNFLINATVDNNTGARLQINGGITYQNIFNRQTANYTLVLTDQNDIVETNVATANTVTVPTNASVAFPIGTEIFVMQYGAGQTSFVAASGVTIRSKANALKIGSQYTGACLVKVGTDEWYLVGSLVL